MHINKKDLSIFSIIELAKKVKESQTCTYPNMDALSFVKAAFYYSPPPFHIGLTDELKGPSGIKHICISVGYFLTVQITEIE